MINVTLTNITNLNNSLQVGDYIYYAQLFNHAVDTEGINNTGNSYLDSGKLGVLRRIAIEGTTVFLTVDNSMVLGPGGIDPYVPVTGDFLMFSKYDQTDGDLTGYFAEVVMRWEGLGADGPTLPVKGELFSIGSEVVINSK